MNALRKLAATAVAVTMPLLAATEAEASVSKQEPILSAATRTFPVTKSSVPHVDISAGAGKGYWLAASDGGVFAIGDAQFAGSAAGVTSHAIVSIAKTKTGAGYWLLASDGGVFAFGDAKFHGSLPGLNPAPAGVIASQIAVSEGGNGYYIVTRAGGVYAFGDAVFRGSPAGFSKHDITGFGLTNGFSGGYWLSDVRGAVYHYGDAPNTVQVINSAASEANRTARVSLVPWSNNAFHLMSLDGAISTHEATENHGFFYGAYTKADYPMTAMASCSCAGYYQVAADGSVYALGDAKFYGSLPQYVSASSLVAPIIGMTASGPIP